MMRLCELTDYPLKADVEALGWIKDRVYDYHTHPAHPNHKLIVYQDKIMHGFGGYPSRHVGSFATAADAQKSVDGYGKTPVKSIRLSS